MGRVFWDTYRQERAFVWSPMGWGWSTEKNRGFPQYMIHLFTKYLHHYLNPSGVFEPSRHTRAEPSDASAASQGASDVIIFG